MSLALQRFVDDLGHRLPHAFRLRWPEFAQLLSLSSYILFAGVYLQLRYFNLGGWLIALSAGILTEWLLASIRDPSTPKETGGKRFRFSAAFISSSALFLLVEVDSQWALAALCSMAIVLKRLIVDDRGHHFFNPASLAIMLAIGLGPDLYLFDPTRIPVRQDFFILVLIMGTLATILADRWRLTLSYLGAFVLMSLMVSLIFDPTSLGFRAYRILAPMNLVFCFHMISDPMTSPRKHSEQIQVGIALALTDLILREFKVYHSTLVAMLLIAGWRGFKGMIDRDLSLNKDEKSVQT